MITLIFSLGLMSQAKETKYPPIDTDLRPSICESVIVETPDLLGKIEKQTKNQMCHNKQFSTALSQNCKDDHCYLILQAMGQKEGLSYSPRGTPGSWLCKKLGGESLMTFIRSAQSGPEARKKVHICQKTQDIVSVDYLLSKMPAQKR